jgi:hypothetical protein
MKCIQCANFSLRGSPIARSGWGYCSHDPLPGMYVSSQFERECDKFAAADEDVVTAREAWLQKNLMATREGK